MFVVYTLVTILTHLHCRYYYFLHFVGTTPGFEFSVEIPSFMSQVTLGHGHLTLTESFTPLPYSICAIDRLRNVTSRGSSFHFVFSLPIQLASGYEIKDASVCV